jgi:hypothetical protein
VKSAGQGYGSTFPDSLVTISRTFRFSELGEMTANSKKTARSKHQTQWVAQFAVASELCKRGYEVAFTMGNHPLKDLMVNSPNGTAFAVDVKGLHKKNTWPVSKRPANSTLFYVFALVPDKAPNRFFILHTGANKHWY